LTESVHADPSGAVSNVAIAVLAKDSFSHANLVVAIDVISPAAEPTFDALSQFAWRAVADWE
jgi:hypothetical protein